MVQLWCNSSKPFKHPHYSRIFLLLFFKNQILSQNKCIGNGIYSVLTRLLTGHNPVLWVVGSFAFAVTEIPLLPTMIWK